MPDIQKKRSLSQPHCRECREPLIVYVLMEKTLQGGSWEGVSLRGGTGGIYLCTSHPRTRYEGEGYVMIGVYEWEYGMPARQEEAIDGKAQDSST